jgi:hypothetical protein
MTPLFGRLYHMLSFGDFAPGELCLHRFPRYEGPEQVQRRYRADPPGATLNHRRVTTPQQQDVCPQRSSAFRV